MSDSGQQRPALPPGQRVTILTAEDERLRGLPEADQRAIQALVGVPGTFLGFDEHGLAEIEYAEPEHGYRTLFVRPAAVAPYQEQQR